MTGHLSEVALVDVLEGAGAPAERAHAQSCARCAAVLTQAREALELATAADVPEPSPLYWEALRRSVGRRIAEEPERRWGIGWLVPVAAALLVAVWVGHAPPSAPSVPATLPAWSALPSGGDVADAPDERTVADSDVGAWNDGRGLGAFVADLSDEEMQSLVEALRAQGEGAEL